MTESAQLVIRLLVDGTVRAETRNIHGDSCVPFAAILEDLCDGEAIGSEYTHDYWLAQEPHANEEVVDRDHA